MQEKTAGIEEINKSMWTAYKEYLSTKDRKSCRKSVSGLEFQYDSELKWFCRNLASAWDPVIDLMERHMENGTDVERIHVCIMDIQNSAWAAYREFLKGHQMPEYTQKAAALVKKYKNDKDMMLFAQTIILSWVPVINSLKQDFRNGGADNEDI